MRVFGLTGGIASGKSLVADRLSQLGAVIVDADLLARAAVESGSVGLAAIEAEFGPGVLTATGDLDRAALGALIFADSSARDRLNAIVHPEVRRLGELQIAAAAADEPDAIVIYDIPLLVEAGPARRAPFDGVIVVTADVRERVRRMVDDRGMTEQDALARIAAQATDDERLAIATHHIDNAGSPAHTLNQIDRLWRELSA